MSTTEYIQIIIGIGQIIAVAIIPIIVWVLGIKYQDRKAKKDAQLRVFRRPGAAGLAIENQPQ